MGCGRGKKVKVPWTEFESQTFDLVIESTPESSVNVRGIASYREFGSSEVESPKSKRIFFPHENSIQTHQTFLHTGYCRETYLISKLRV